MRLAIACLTAFLIIAAPAAGQDPLRAQQWGLDLINADSARSVSKGRGATIAIIDSGVRLDHPDLQGRVTPGHDFVDGDETPNDGDGHGTHVLGIAGAATGNGIGVAGVAPEATMLAVRVLDDDGAGSEDDVAAGIDHAVARGANVINLSLGEIAPVSVLLGGGGPMDQAIDRALDRGVVVVAASGNTGVPVCEQPSAEGRLLCVGSVDRRGMRSAFSSFGRGLGLVAPGGSGMGGPEEDVLSTFRDPLYEAIAGTSQAAPHVAGVAGLLVSLGVRGQDAVRRILATARDAGPSGPDMEYGAGIVDARAAVAGLGGGSGAGTGAGSGGSGSSGTGAPAAGGGSSSSSAARVTMARRLRARTVLRRGLRVRCTASGAGRCSVSVTAAGRRVARGSRAVTAGRATTVVARVTAAGRRLLRRRGRTLRTRVTVTVPGASPVRRTVTIVRR